MKKIVIAFDGRHFSEGAFEFVKLLNEKQAVLVTGVFLPVVDYAELLYSIGGISGPIYYKEVEMEDTGIVLSNIKHFKTKCEHAGIEFRVHQSLDKHVISELKHESRYADLMVVGSELFYENLGNSTQDDYIGNVLHKSECPVILIPENYKHPENAILTFDGGASSVYAIKQFSYLLPELIDNKATLVFAGTGSEHIPDLDYVKEYVSRHYNDLNIFKLQVNPELYFNTWLMDHSNSILVTGAYGRSAFSEMIKKSFITNVIHDHRLPIFIAHK